MIWPRYAQLINQYLALRCVVSEFEAQSNRHGLGQSGSLMLPYTPLQQTARQVPGLTGKREVGI